MNSVRNTLHILALSTLFLYTGSLQSLSQDIHSYLPNPNELGIWHAVDSVRVFTGEELYTLIDGGADMYLEYGFQRVMTAEYENPQERSIKLEIYEMTDAAAAAGLFSLNIGTQGKPVAIGNEGRQYDYHIMFWKNRFLVFVSGNDTLKETSVGIRTIASTVNDKLGPLGKMPAILEYLPSKDLKKSTYLRGILSLSSLYTFDTKNIFGMKEGVLGKYPTHSCFIFRYSSEKEAEEGYNNALGALRSGSRFTGCNESSGHLTMIDLKNSHLCVTHVHDLIVIILCEPKNDAVAISEDVLSYIHQH
ncbi:MAG: hypothetical protein NTX44_05540 [Ignavibacteriales bacterium]|nr:hypothetical protein [Ignavibacteriales bacterium]